MLNKLAYNAGCMDAQNKFAATLGSLVPPAAPKAPSPVSSIVANKPPPPVGGVSAPGAAPTAVMGAPAAAGVPSTPGMAMQGSPVLSTGEKPAANSASVAGQTALQGAQKSVTTHGGGK